MILCRNEDLNGIKSSIENFELKFNKNYKYPYVFLNDKEFDKEFKLVMDKVTNYNSSYGLIPPEQWNMPKNIDVNKAKSAWKALALSGVPYAEKESYHNMCRFFSRSFYKHPLLKSYKYYWRIEPNVKFHCDITEDPFDFMENNNKVYSFVITMNEFMNSISTLMTTTARFLFENKHKIPKKDTLNFMYENGKYNGCHFWSNFEIASFDFFRSTIYNEYVDYLENAGGFYYERWGDAPIHSIAASIFLDQSQIHFFENIGYTHDFFTHCPSNGTNCDCDPKKSLSYTQYSCLPKYINEKNLRKNQL